MDEDVGRDGGAARPQRPLPPPPTLREFLDVFRERIALRYPGFDATKAVLVVAALVGIAGMGWAVTRHPTGPAAPVRVMTSSTTGSPSTTVASTTSVEQPTTLVVDVAGAVRHPGPVTIRSGDRVVDAIEAAGGVSGDADLERVDRAARLRDGQRVYVPRRGQGDIPEIVGADGSASPDSAMPDAEGAPTAGGAPVQRVDLNTADVAALDTLPGVGPATAQAIVDYRTSHGRFTSVDQLLEVKGIGPAKLANMRAHVTV